MVSARKVHGACFIWNFLDENMVHDRVGELVEGEGREVRETSEQSGIYTKTIRGRCNHLGVIERLHGHRQHQQRWALFARIKTSVQWEFGIKIKDGQHERRRNLLNTVPGYTIARLGTFRAGFWRETKRKKRLK